MAELADALDSGSNGRKFVQVQVLLSAPRRLDFDFKVRFVFFIADFHIVEFFLTFESESGITVFRRDFVDIALVLYLGNALRSLFFFCKKKSSL